MSAAGRRAESTPCTLVSPSVCILEHYVSRIAVLWARRIRGVSTSVATAALECERREQYP